MLDYNEEEYNEDILTNILTDSEKHIYFEGFQPDVFQPVILSEENASNIQLFPFGIFFHPWYGIITFDKKFFKDMIKNFRKLSKIHPFIDEQHDAGKAKAWITDIHVNKKGLYADLDWTEVGWDLVKKKEYKFISPWYGEYTDEETGKKHLPVLFGAALTNRPFLKVMPEIQSQLEDGKKFKIIHLDEFDYKSYTKCSVGQMKELITLYSETEDSEIRERFKEKIMSLLGGEKVNLKDKNKKEIKEKVEKVVELKEIEEVIEKVEVKEVEEKVEVKTGEKVEKKVEKKLEEKDKEVEVEEKVEKKVEIKEVEEKKGTELKVETKDEMIMDLMKENRELAYKIKLGEIKVILNKKRSGKVLTEKAKELLKNILLTEKVDEIKLDEDKTTNLITAVDMFLSEAMFVDLTVSFEEETEKETGDVQDKFTAKVYKVAKEKGITYAEAFDIVRKENPELAEEALKGQAVEV